MKEKWIKLGDFNSQMMCSRVKHKNRRMKLSLLKIIRISWVKGHDQVTQVIMDSLLDICNPKLDNQHDERIELTLS